MRWVNTLLSLVVGGCLVALSGCGEEKPPEFSSDKVRAAIQKRKGDFGEPQGKQKGVKRGGVGPKA
jgi:predicted small lipoprotein YifL